MKVALRLSPVPNGHPIFMIVKQIMMAYIANERKSLSIVPKPLAELCLLFFRPNSKVEMGCFGCVGDGSLCGPFCSPDRLFAVVTERVAYLRPAPGRGNQEGGFRNISIS